MLAGTGAPGLRETVELTRAAKAFGYDAAMVVTVRIPALRLCVMSLMVLLL